MLRAFKCTPLNVTLFIIAVLVGVAVYIGSWSVRHGDMVFNADIGRDFLLFHELDSDPIMLIGPRADYKGLFHGPAWLYVNYPAYVVGHGNPIAVATWWIVLTLLFAGVNYWIASKVFDKTSAVVFAAIFTVSTMHYVNQFYNPTGAMFIAPLLVFCAYIYSQTRRVSWLAVHLFLAGMMLQFQLAAGIPVLIMSTMAMLWLIVRRKDYKHVIAFLILLVPLSTFILFEIKFGFSQFNAVLNHFNGTETFYSLSFEDKLADRYGRIVGPGLGFFAGKYGHYNKMVALFIGASLAYVIHRKKVLKSDLSIYWWGLYFYVGFYVLSFIHNGSVLLHYYLPFMFIPVMLFSSLHRWVDKRIFFAVVVLVLVINILHLSDEQKEYQSLLGTHFTSWISLQEAMKPVKEAAQDGVVGVWVYAPDAYAYAPKYAALYTQRNSPDGNVRINEKLDTTYLLYEPVPKDFPWLNGRYWKSDLLGIASAPVGTQTFKSGYKLEKYKLSDEDKKSPVDPLAMDWVSQR